VNLVKKPLNRHNKVNYSSILLLLLVLWSLIVNTSLNSFFIIKNNPSNENNDIKETLNSSAFPSNADFFKYYKIITIDHTKLVQSSYINFPFLISLYDSDMHRNVQDNGNDIAFAIDNSWLDHEIEHFNKNYNTTHAKLIVWVRIPSLSGTVDTNITMYYGNSTMSSRQNPSGVWFSNYKGVWHLSESTGNVLDSTSYSTSGSVSGTVNRVSTGVIHNAYDFGSNSQIYFGDPADGHLDMGTGSFTISFWINLDQWTGNYVLPIYKGATTSTDIGYDFETSWDGGTMSFRICDGEDDLAESPYLDNDYDDWMYVVGVVDRSSNRIRIFKNGMQVGSGSSCSTIGSVSTSIALRGPYNIYYLDGLFDEVRISNIQRSTGWIYTEYENQKDPGSFYTVGSQQIYSNEPLNANYFTYYKTITIDHTKISGTGSHANFPLLISIFDSDLRFDVQPDGDDIAFAHENEWLDHEIELFNQSYNATHAQLIAWVRIPFLYTDVDTNITMYYSNSTMSSQQDPTGVWSTNYMGVWHLSESSGLALDSTSYATHGTISGGVAQGCIGQIDGAYDFDGINDVVNMGDPIDGHLDFGVQSFSFSLWVNCPLTSSYQDIFYKGAREDAVAGYCFYRRWAAEGGSTTVSVGDGTSRIKNDFYITSDIWEYIVAVVDRTTNRLHVYKNGVEQGTGVDISSIGSISSTLSFRLGDGYDNADASVDEVRIIRTIYSINWIQTEYNNQYDPNSFYSVDTEELVSDIPPNADYFNFYKIITTDHSMISGENSHVNFPLLISIFDSDLRYDVQSDGDDIAFAQNGKWLSHEIEKFTQNYNSTHAQLVAWVRIPYLYPIENMNITMYYGNITMSARQNPSDVWISNYMGVWHLKEDPSGTPPQIKDSSVPYSDGSSYGVMTSSDQVSGMIDGALDFDGSNDYIDFGNPGELQITGEITVQAWFKAEIAIDNDYLVVKHGADGDRGWDISFDDDPAISPDGWVMFRYSPDGSNILITGHERVKVDKWYHVVGVFKPNEYSKLFLNGTEVALNTTGIPPSMNNPSLPVRIARRSDSATSYFDGLVDEARVSNIARSNDWILTEYNNQYDPQSFYSVGEEKYAKGVLLAGVQINVINRFGNLIPNLNISMYSYTQLIRNGISNINGSVTFSDILYAEYNFTVSMKSDIGNNLEIVNRTSETILIDKPFQAINLSCNVGINFFEVEDIDGIALDTGWIIVGNSTHNLRNCTIDSTGKARFWWVNTTPYAYNYTVYYQNNQYNPTIVKLTSGNITTPNTTISVQVELTTVDFTILTFPEGEAISGIKVILRLNNTFGVRIVNLTADQNGIASLRWLTSSGLNGNYSVQLEYYGEIKQFNKTIGGPYNWTEYSFEIINKLSLEFRILISLADFQTELVSLNPNDYIEVKWGEILKLRILFNITKAGGLDYLLGPSYTDSMVFSAIKAGQVIYSGTFSNEDDNIGKHYAFINTSLLDSKTSYLIIISAQKSGYSLPSELILQLSVLENELVLQQSENDDSAQSVYWLENPDFSVQPYGVASEEFTIQEQLFQDENHNFMFSLPDIENQWNISQVIFNIYNISWTVGASNINITIIDPYGQFYMFHASNHTGENYLLGEWIGISINLNKNSPTLNNNFEFVVGGSFSGTIDVIADIYFIRDKIEAKYVKVNITDTINILSEADGWAIKEIRFELFNCYDTDTWNLIDPLTDAHLNITTNEGFTYSLDVGYGNGTGSLIIDNRLIHPISRTFLFTIESTLNLVFDVIIYIDYIQEFYCNDNLEELNSLITMNNVNNGGLLQINVIDGGWTENYAMLNINGINNGISYFLPSELAMSITIGGQTFSIVDLSRGYGTFSLEGYSKDNSYSAVITTNQQVTFNLALTLIYSRIINYEVLGTVSYTILEAPSIHGDVTYDSNMGYYLQPIDTSLIDADKYTIRFTVIKQHYISAIKNLDLVVLNRLTLINGSSEFFRAYQTIYVKDALNLTLSYIDALTGIGINTLDTFSYIWEGYDDIGNVVDSGEGTLIFKTNGIYSLDFDTEVRSVGEYLLIITLDKENYDNRNGMVLLTIEKRIFNYSLGENFKERQVSAVKGKNIPIEIRLLDLTKRNIALENATVLLYINGVEYNLEEFENGTYIFTFSTAEIEAFFASKILTGVINISKLDYISQEFQITIVVGMEEIFPGFSTFYFLLIIVGIICFAGSITVYQVYKKAKIPKFVKKVRAIQKAIEGEKEIAAELLYREKAVYVGELVKEYWDVLGLSLAEILGIEIKRTQKSDKAKRRDFTLEKQHEYRPVGLALMRWNERIGTEIIAKYPEEVQISDKSLMQIYSTHEYTGDKGIVTLMDGALNLVSYYTGPEQGYYLLLLLDLNDDPDLYESGMVDILQTILRNLQEESYVQLLPSLFQRLSVYPSYNEEQMFYYTYQNDIKRIIIHYLQDDGVIAKSELTIWLKDMYKEGFVDIDSALTELMKMGIIKQVSIKGLPSELLFLIKDIYMLRIPPIHLLKEPKKRGLPPNVVKLYLSEVKKFYENYKPSKEDNLKVVELLSLPQVYETFKLLRTSIVTMQDLEKLRKKGVEDIYSVLKQLWDNNMVKVFHDDQNTEYYALLSDFYVDYIFPKYVTRIIQNAYEQKSKADKILIEYLKVLEQTYFDLLKKS
jgi:hypothetical protein